MKFKASHKVASILILCYLVAWLDRMAINMAIPFIQKDLNIGPQEMGWILSAFFAGYALFQVPGGLLADKIGPRKVIVGALSWWSVFTAMTGMVSSLVPMLFVRFSFGVGEGFFPASVWKVLAQWFTKKNRATMNAIVISSIALGPALTPLILAPIITKWGWRFSFYCLGALGVVCVFCAWRYITDSIQQSKTATREEIEEYEADAKSVLANTEASIEKVSFWDLVKTPVIWILFSIGLIFNITMYGWLTWLPVYLLKVKGLDMKQMAMAASLPFMFATVGCVIAGYVSDRWFRGRRKILGVLCTVIGGICLYFFTQVTDVTTYMILQCIAGFMLFMACGAIQAISVVMLPVKFMGAGSGLVNMGGQIGGFVTNIIIGYYIAFRNNDYAAGFDIMLGALVIATLVLFFGIHEKRATVASGEVTREVPAH